eukprot:gene13184-biopygen11226
MRSSTVGIAVFAQPAASSGAPNVAFQRCGGVTTARRRAHVNESHSTQHTAAATQPVSQPRCPRSPGHGHRCVSCNDGTDVAPWSGPLPATLRTFAADPRIFAADPRIGLRRLVRMLRADAARPLWVRAACFTRVALDAALTLCHGIIVSPFTPYTLAHVQNSEHGVLSCIGVLEMKRYGSRLCQRGIGNG